MSDQTATKSRKRSTARRNQETPPAPPAEETPAAAEPVAETPAIPEPDALTAMKGLYDDLLGRVRELDGSEITEKAAYARVRVPGGGKLKTVVYVNHPSKKTVRLEFPNGSGGYDVVKVEDESGVTAAFDRIQKDAAALAAAQ